MNTDDLTFFILLAAMIHIMDCLEFAAQFCRYSHRSGAAKTIYPQALLTADKWFCHYEAVPYSAKPDNADILQYRYHLLGEMNTRKAQNQLE